MLSLSSIRYILLLLLLASCILISYGKGGRGGGGSRGGGGRSSGGGWGRSSSSSSSRYSSSSSSSSAGKSSSSSSSTSGKSFSSSTSGKSTHGASSSSLSSSVKKPSSTSVRDYDLSSGGGANYQKPKPATHQYFGSGLPTGNFQRLPFHQQQLGSPAISLPQGIPNANYPRQPISSNPFLSSQSSSLQGSIPNVNYPKQPSFNPFFQSSPAQGGILNTNYPKQGISLNSFLSSQSSSLQGGIPNFNYPKQPSFNPFFQSSSAQGGIPNVNYPKQSSFNPLFQSSPSQGGLNADYPRQMISFPQGGIINTNYPRQTISSNPVIPLHSSSSQGGMSNANYPRQPMSSNPFVHSSSSQGVVPNANYPRQTHQLSGNSQPQGLPTVNFPRQATIQNPREKPTIQVQPIRTSSLYNRPSNDFSSANYPKQPSMPSQILGSGVWNPKSGTSSPVYMNYGGLPTGANMYTKPLKKKGFLGQLISLGSAGRPYKNKHYRSYPSPYGMGGGRPADVMGSFMGNKGSKTAMYTILPYMAARKSPKIFKPKFRFYSYRPIHYHSHGYHSHGYHSHLHDTEYANVRYDVYNNDYVGRCNRPIKPDHAQIVCNSTHNQVDCGVTCDEGYRYPDNTTNKSNKCWHEAGVWNPKKNFPACEPVCNECRNGGKCASPGVCRCQPEYRGPHCEFHFLKCDIRKLAKGVKIRWTCTHTKNVTSCRVKCRSSPKSTEAHLYKCTSQGVWTPPSIPLSLCTQSESEASTVETRESSTLPEEMDIKTS